MALFTIQVTIPAGGGPVQVSSSTTPFRVIVFQNNSAGTMRIGASNVSATVGYLLAATGGALSVRSGQPGYCGYPSDWWVVGTATQVLDVFFYT
jgi:hypothetical protein